MNQNQNQPDPNQGGDDESQQDKQLIGEKRSARQAKIAVGDNAA